MRGRIFRRGRIWWVAYYCRDREYRESTRSIERADARKLLHRRQQELYRGTFVGPEQDQVMLDDLLNAVRLDYLNNGRSSLSTLDGRLKTLRRYFGRDRALAVSETRLEQYKAARLREDAAAATINRELSTLRRAFHLGIRQRQLSTRPVITLLREDNVRQGFFERTERRKSNAPNPGLPDREGETGREDSRRLARPRRAVSRSRRPDGSHQPPPESCCRRGHRVYGAASPPGRLAGQISLPQIPPGRQAATDPRQPTV
jgi:hypothetical protein